MVRIYLDAEKRIHSKQQPQMANIGKSRQYISREKRQNG